MSGYGSSSVVVSGERWQRLLRLARLRGDRAAVATLEARLQAHAGLAMRDRATSQRLAAWFVAAAS